MTSVDKDGLLPVLLDDVDLFLLVMLLATVEISLKIVPIAGLSSIGVVTVDPTFLSPVSYTHLTLPTILLV